jgi:hypothetical protein
LGRESLHRTVVTFAIYKLPVIPDLESQNKIGIGVGLDPVPLRRQMIC